MKRFFPALLTSLLTLGAAALPDDLPAQTPSNAAVTTASLTSLPTADQIRMLLESTDAKEQAWGAWWVTQTRARNVDALLQTNLKAHLTGRGILDEAVMDATLDAMIQLGGNAPPLELLQSTYAVRPAQSLILLSRVFPRPPVDAFLLTLLDREAGKGLGLEWFAAANLLLRDQATGLSAAILKGLYIQAVVIVCDLGQPCGRQNIGSGSVGDGFGRPQPDLPPWPTYYLQIQSPITSAGLGILASGPTSIVYRRNVLPAGVARSTSSETRSPPSPTTAERLKYLAAAAPGVQIPFEDNETRAMTWRDQQTLTSDVESFRQDIVQRYSTLVQRLRGVGRLSAEEAEALAKPKLEITIEDRHIVRTPQ